MNDDENQRLNNKNKMKIINVDTVDQIDRLEMMKKRRRAKKEQLTIVLLPIQSTTRFLVLIWQKNRVVDVSDALFPSLLLGLLFATSKTTTTTKTMAKTTTTTSATATTTIFFSSSLSSPLLLIALILNQCYYLPSPLFQLTVYVSYPGEHRREQLKRREGIGHYHFCVALWFFCVVKRILDLFVLCCAEKCATQHKNIKNAQHNTKKRQQMWSPPSHLFQLFSSMFTWIGDIYGQLKKGWG